MVENRLLGHVTQRPVAGLRSTLCVMKDAIATLLLDRLLLTEPTNTERDRHADQNHMDKKPLQQLPVLVGSRGMQSRERQHNKTHCQINRDAKE